MPFSTFQDVEQYLNSLINYEHEFPVGGARNRLKLEPTLAAVERLGLSLSLPRCIHITGTKGKGSCVAMLETLAGGDSGLLSFTSPHLLSVKERVRINGLPLDDEIWIDGMNEIVSALEKPPSVSLSYFESTFIQYLWTARRLMSKVHVVEVGLGGRWDATNVLTDSIAVLMPVDYDHTHVLGNTLTEIAADKAGIIKENASVVVSRQQPEAHDVIASEASKRGATVFWLGESFGWDSLHKHSFDYADERGRIPGLTLPLTGLHQRDNAAVALRCIRHIFPEMSADILRKRLSCVSVPGRQQLLRGTPDVLLDVAHNPASFAALAAVLRSDYSTGRKRAVIGMMKDKDARSSLAQLSGLVDEVLCVDVGNLRSLPPDDLAAIAREAGFNAQSLTSRYAAFERLHSESGWDLGIVAGSFYLAGDYLAWRRDAGIA